MLMRFQDAPDAPPPVWECRYWQRPHHRGQCACGQGDEDMPVSQHTTATEPSKIAAMVEASIKPLAFLTYYPWLIRREYRISPVNRLSTNTHQRIAEKRIDTKADTAAPSSFRPLANIITRPLAKLPPPARQTAQKECKHLQTPFADGLAPLRIELRFQ